MTFIERVKNEPNCKMVLNKNHEPCVLINGYGIAVGWLHLMLLTKRDDTMAILNAEFDQSTVECVARIMDL